MSNFFGNNRAKALIIGGCCLFAASALTLRLREAVVKDKSLAPLVAA